MRPHHLLIVWAALFTLTCLPLCSSYVQEQVNPVANSSSSAVEQINSTISLPDGQEIQADVPLNSHSPMIFLYKPDSPTNRQPLVVTVRCPGREIIVYARRTTPNSQYPFESALTEETADFSSFANQNHLEGMASVSVPPMANPVESTIVIAVYFNDVQPPKTPTRMSTKFTILASSRITHLFAGVQYSGSVTKDHYVYFMVPIMRSEGALLISLTSEGETGLVASFGSEARPTISGPQFASTSFSKNQIIEISSNDISPRDVMSGNLIIGVYANTTSSFTLAVAYQATKMIDLTIGTPVDLTVNGSSPANFKFLHKSKSNLQIQLKKFSGELNLYMICLNPTQNLATNLLDRSNQKWQIFNADSQSFLNIPARDLQACVSSLYLFNIEVLSSPTTFQILISEEFGFVPLEDEVTYPGQLRPQEYAPFTLRAFSVSKDAAKLRFEVQGSELEILGSHDPKISTTNYVHKEKIPFNANGHIIPVKKTKGSAQETFYILLYNPTDADVSYNFTVAVKSSRTLSMNNGKQGISIRPHQKISLLYYSNIINDDKISLQISSLGAQDARDNRDLVKGSDFLQSVESALNKGEIIKGRFWAEEEPSGPGQDVSFEILAPTFSFYALANGHERAQIYQTLFVKTFKGKYLIDIINPWESTLSFDIEMKASKSDTVFLGQNFHRQEQISRLGQTYEIFLSKEPVKWYYWLYACDGPSNLTIQIGNKESKSIGLAKGESYLYKEAAENNRTDRFRTVKVNVNKNKEKLWMHSALIDDSKLFDYDVKGGDLKMNISSDHKTEWDNQMTVKFSPVQFQDPDPTDQVDYYVEICPFKNNTPSFCQEEQGCYSTMIKFSVDHKELITARFKSVYVGEYFVKIKANVIHQERIVRFVPYPVHFVKVEGKSRSESLPKFEFAVVVVIAAVVGGMLVIWMLVYFGKWQQKNEELRKQHQREDNKEKIV